MEESIWSVAATRITENEMCRGTLCLIQDELVFFHEFKNDIIPIDVFTISVQESTIQEELFIKNQKMLSILEGNENIANFIVPSGTAETLNELFLQMRSDHNCQNELLQRQIHSEEEHLLSLREQARERRKVFWEQLQSKKEKARLEQTGDYIYQEAGQEHLNQEAVQEPLGKEMSQEFVDQEVVQEPLGQEMAQEFVEQEVVQEPLGQEMSQEFIDQEVVQKPQAQETVQKSIDQVDKQPVHPAVQTKKKEENDDLIRTIKEKGIPEDAAEKIAAIIMNHDLREKIQFYHQMRRTFGQANGTKYYHQTVNIYIQYR